MHTRTFVVMAASAFWVSFAASGRAAPSPEMAFQTAEDTNEIRISSTELDAVIKKQGYVSGISGGSFLDKKTGFRDAGFGLDIVDWIMEPGRDEAYRNQLTGDLAYEFNNLFHGQRAKRSIEGPQICTQAKQLSPQLIQGKDFVAVRSSYTYTLAAPGKRCSVISKADFSRVTADFDCRLRSENAELRL